MKLRSASFARWSKHNGKKCIFSRSNQSPHPREDSRGSIVNESTISKFRLKHCCRYICAAKVKIAFRALPAISLSSALRSTVVFWTGQISQVEISQIPPESLSFLPSLIRFLTPHDWLPCAAGDCRRRCCCCCCLSGNSNLNVVKHQLFGRNKSLARENGPFFHDTQEIWITVASSWHVAFFNAVLIGHPKGWWPLSGESLSDFRTARASRFMIWIQLKTRKMVFQLPTCRGQTCFARNGTIGLCNGASLFVVQIDTLLQTVSDQLG